ncbi:coiled-coil domain-containing protein 97 isoform X2 [Elgaria multicarinata webbii]
MQGRCLPDKIEAAEPLHSAEEAMEILATKACSPKSNGVPDVSLQVSRGDESKPGVPGAYSFPAANSCPMTQRHWGEEMSGVPDSHSYPLSRNGASKMSSRRDGQLWNSASNRSTSCGIEAQIFLLTGLGPLPSCWGEFQNKTPTANHANEATEPSHPVKGSPETVASEDSSPDREEASDVTPSHWDGGKRQPVGSKLAAPGPVQDDDPAVLAMFRAVASSRLAVRSQQKDEPDFTPTQKLAILQDLYRTKPLVFLERFRTALREEHLPCFQHLSGNYEADFYCAEVRRAGLGKTRHTRVRNKRYAALQQLIRDGEYFSDEQMRCRDPLLYEQYIGQYLSEEELQALGSSKLEAAGSLSGVLLDSYQEQVIQRRLQVQQELEEACEEEEEEDSDDDDGEDKASDPGMEEWVPDQEEKAILREEFTSRMYQRFLDGKDGDFNYSEVDENPDFDNLDIVTRDEEERYFDGEEPEEADAMEAE